MLCFLGVDTPGIAEQELQAVPGPTLIRLGKIFVHVNSPHCWFGRSVELIVALLGKEGTPYDH
jgi:hypothetical protein